MKLKKLWEIFIGAVSDTLTSWLGKFLFSSFGSIAAILFFWKNLRDYRGGLLYYFGIGIVVLIVCILLFRFFKFAAERVKEHYRTLIIESLYGEAIILLKNAFSYIHYLRKTDTIGNVDIGKAMIAVCDSIKKIFDTKTKSICAVSIKIPISRFIEANPNDEKPFTEVVKTLCRDTNSLSRNNDTQNSIRHTIVGNTPYHKILLKACSRENSDPLYYVNNDIKSSRDYENTSRGAYPDGQLPYNSQFVISIMPIIPTESEKNRIAGFLVIDSNIKYSFGDKYDIAMLEGVADGLYDVIMRANEILNN